jgi:hypothetical protein
MAKMVLNSNNCYFRFVHFRFELRPIGSQTNDQKGRYTYILIKTRRNHLKFKICDVMAI